MEKAKASEFLSLLAEFIRTFDERSRRGGKTLTTESMDNMSKLYRSHIVPISPRDNRHRHENLFRVTSMPFTNEDGRTGDVIGKLLNGKAVSIPDGTFDDPGNIWRMVPYVKRDAYFERRPVLSKRSKDAESLRVMFKIDINRSSSKFGKGLDCVGDMVIDLDHAFDWMSKDKQTRYVIADAIASVLPDEAEKVEDLMHSLGDSRSLYMPKFVRVDDLVEGRSAAEAFSGCVMEWAKMRAVETDYKHRVLLSNISVHQNKFKIGNVQAIWIQTTDFADEIDKILNREGRENSKWITAFCAGRPDHKVARDDFVRIANAMNEEIAVVFDHKSKRADIACAPVYTVDHGRNEIAKLEDRSILRNHDD